MSRYKNCNAYWSTNDAVYVIYYKKEDAETDGHDPSSSLLNFTLCYEVPYDSIVMFELELMGKIKLTSNYDDAIL